jgi:hypothetical protein
MYKYHHLGIPTNEKREGETYLPEFKMFVSGYEDSEFHIEWMRYEEDSPVHPLVKKIPHVAFEVEDIEKAIEGKEILIPPNSPSAGTLVAFIAENGAPIEFIRVTPES